VFRQLRYILRTYEQPLSKTSMNLSLSEPANVCLRYRCVLPFIVIFLFSSCALTPSVYYPLKQDYVEATEVLAGSRAVEGIQDYQSGRLDLALKHFQEAEALLGDSTSVALRRNLSIAFLRAGFPEESVRYMEELSQELPDSQQVLFDHANALAAAGNFQEAEKIYRDVLEESYQIADFPTSAGIARALARLYFDQGYEQEASCTAWVAFSLNPVVTEVPFFIDMLLATGNFHALIAELETRFPPPAFGGSAEVAWGLALSSIGIGDLEKYRMYSARARQMLHPDESLETKILATNQLLFGKKWIEQEIAALQEKQDQSQPDKKRKRKKSAEVSDDEDDIYADLIVEDPREPLRNENPLKLPPSLVILIQNQSDSDE
jgi:tetratricopeptide (TPR) repeat protein